MLSILIRTIFLASLLTVSITRPVMAQLQPERKVYTYVEKMPQLPGGGGAMAIAKAIQQRIVYPSAVARECVEGRVLVGFTVTETGTVENVTIEKSLHPAYDSAAIAAVRQLPQFEPGQQAGKPVAVHLTAPINFQLASEKKATGKRKNK